MALKLEYGGGGADSISPLTLAPQPLHTSTTYVNLLVWGKIGVVWALCRHRKTSQIV